MLKNKIVFVSLYSISFLYSAEKSSEQSFLRKIFCCCNAKKTLIQVHDMQEFVNPSPDKSDNISNASFKNESEKNESPSQGSFETVPLQDSYEPYKVVGERKKTVSFKE